MKIKNRKIIITIIICIILISIGVAGKGVSSDTFYTIKIGEYINNHGIGNLTEDPFSWHNLPYTFPHWLYDFMMYRIYLISGWTSIYISTIVFTIILGITTFTICYKKSKNEIISGILTIAGLITIRPFLVARAQMLSFEIFLLTVFFIDKLLETGKNRYSILLVILSLLLVNIHMGTWPFMMILFMPSIAENILIYILNLKNKKRNKEFVSQKEYTISRIELKKDEHFKKLLVTLILCILMGVFTPTGLTTPYTYLYKAMTGNTTKAIAEYAHIGAATLYKYFILVFGAFILADVCDIKIRLKTCCLYIGVLLMCMLQQRHLPICIILILPINCKILDEIINKYFPKLLSKIRNFLNKIYSPIFLFMIVVLYSYKLYRPNLVTKYVSGKLYPTEASTWIIENLDYKNIKIFNEYNYGSYLLYRGIPVMIDNRAELYSPEFNTRTGNPKDGIDIFDDVVNKIEKDKFFDEYSYFKKNEIEYVICTINNRVLYEKISKNTDKYEEIYPAQIEKVENTTFKVYKVHYEKEE